jgi:hypothetical protein
MKSSSLVLFPETVYVAGTAPTLIGTRQKGVGYYSGQGNSQNIRFICNDFNGLIYIQASLDTDPKTSDATGEIPYNLAPDWATVYEFPSDSADGSTLITADMTIALYGKYTWVRAVVHNFIDGSVGPVTMSY